MSIVGLGAKTVILAMFLEDKGGLVVLEKSKIAE